MKAFITDPFVLLLPPTHSFPIARRAGAAVAVAMAGGYVPDVEAIVTIHGSTVREAGRRTP